MTVSSAIPDSLAWVTAVDAAERELARPLFNGDPRIDELRPLIQDLEDAGELPPFQDLSPERKGALAKIYLLFPEDLMRFAPLWEDARTSLFGTFVEGGERSVIWSSGQFDAEGGVTGWCTRTDTYAPASGVVVIGDTRVEFAIGEGEIISVPSATVLRQVGRGVTVVAREVDSLLGSSA
jgi:hypothetical protein